MENNVKGSQAGSSQFSSGDSQWLLDSGNGASLLVLNLALGLPNSESLFYMTPGPRMDHRPPSEDWLRPAVCLQGDKDRRTGGVQMSVFMNNPDSSDDTDALCNSFT